MLSKARSGGRVESEATARRCAVNELRSSIQLAPVLGAKTYQILNGSLLQKLLRRLQLIPICQNRETERNEYLF